ncbi:AIM24 family protein [Candidatus Saccharibacteria bacterium]|nr:AIM24 family protein [Candidatus Saccharibacteria bacterium]
MYIINNLTNETSHIITERKGILSIVEHAMDYSVAPDNAMNEYFMSQMNVKRRQVIAQLDGKVGLVLQSGSMQWLAGNVQATTGVKGVGDFIGKVVRSQVTKESAIKPEYVGNGILVTEPTFKYLLLESVGDWAGGLVMEDGMFLACESTVKQEIQVRSSFSSALVGNEGLFNLKLAGTGACVMESNVPRSELVEVLIDNDVLKIDGSFAICWSGSLGFTVERSGKTLLGSAASGEGLVNVYRGTGRVLLAPLTSSSSMYAATH